jgi:hypothetical protein
VKERVQCPCISITPGPVNLKQQFAEMLFTA